MKKISFFLRDAYPDGTSDEEILKSETLYEQEHKKQLDFRSKAKTHLKKEGSGFRNFGYTSKIEQYKKEKQIYDEYRKSINPDYKPKNIRDFFALGSEEPDEFEYIVNSVGYYTELFFEEKFHIKLDPREIGKLACDSFRAYYEEGNEYLEAHIERYKQNLSIVNQAFTCKKGILNACKTLDSLGAKYPRELERAEYVTKNFRANQKRKLLTEILNANFPFITQKTVLNKIIKNYRR